MPTAVSPSASSRRVTGTMTPDPPARSRAANSSRDGVVSPSRTGDLQLAVEAGALAGVAGRPLLVDEDEQRVAVAVQPDVADPLAVAGGLALHPVLAPAARPVGGPARGEGAAQRLVVHPGQHQHLSGVVLLDDGGHEPGGVVLQQSGDLRVEPGGRGGTGGRDGGHARQSAVPAAQAGGVPSNQRRPGPVSSRPSATAGAVAKNSVTIRKGDAV